ncbi:hypothetical protein FIBSPDRAFT_870705 [Athelia psychrophila]|uniref:Uncharacterized protein n=1 Tax=Athelia psychrophila TaxID=1759441 RepID=A0A166ATS2_9AGAM|nr:hypothetical protein FIBSPDRAFT_870705 [Fibularhizoctonia sp. CBS 109695]
MWARTRTQAPPGCTHVSRTKPFPRAGNRAGAWGSWRSCARVEATKALVALQVQDDTQEAEAEHLPVEEDGDGDEETAERIVSRQCDCFKVHAVLILITNVDSRCANAKPAFKVSIVTPSISVSQQY